MDAEIVSVPALPHATLSALPAPRGQPPMPPQPGGWTSGPRRAVLPPSARAAHAPALLGDSQAEKRDPLCSRASLAPYFREKCFRYGVAEQLPTDRSWGGETEKICQKIACF